MNTETMSIHKALSELKIIGDRINSAISSTTFVVANKHSNEKISGIPVVDFKKQMQGGYDKASDLIRRRNAIKQAVVLSNAKTEVEIAGTKYVVAEAIEMKNSGMDFKKTLLQTIKNQYAKSVALCEKENGEDLQRKAESYVTGLYGQKDKADATVVEGVKKQFIENNSFELVDPLTIKNKIDELEQEIASFLTEVDSALSVSNAITNISVEY